MAVYKTPTAERAFIDIYKKSAKKFGMKTAIETLRQLEEVESNLAKNPQLGKIDPQYHSNQFRFIQIKNRQKIFYETHGDDVFIVMADYDGRDFKALLKQMAPQIKMDVLNLQNHLSKKTKRESLSNHPPN
jgi:plasmid stabilization system protein ParE